MVKNLKLLDKALQLLPEVKETVVEPLDIAAFLKPLKKGEVIEILERANDTFVGTLEVAKSYAFLVTENRTLANDIFIPKDKLKGGKTGR